MFSRSIIRSVRLGVILLIAVPSLAQDIEKTSPVPTDEAQTQSMKMVKEVYGDEYANAKTGAEAEVGEEADGEGQRHPG